MATPRRPNVLGIHSMDHFSLAVPNPEEGRKFFEAFGLDVKQEGGAFSFSAQDGHRVFDVVKGPRKQLRYVAFGAFEDDMPRFAEHFKKLGVETISPPEGADSNGIWIRNPDGLAIEVRPAEKSSPNSKSTFAGPSTVGPGKAAAYGRSKAAKVHPRRLSHVGLFTPDVLRAIEFYEKVLGMRLSDRSEDIVAFLHGPHGSDHHLIALIKSDRPGFHHSSWDVGSIEEVGLGAMQTLEATSGPGWGLGRHVLGSNYFHYVRDPWGSFAEYSADIDYVPVDHDWQAANHDPGDSLNLWGATPPEGFIQNHEDAA